jgi:hypothetical protein
VNGCVDDASGRSNPADNLPQLIAVKRVFHLLDECAEAFLDYFGQAADHSLCPDSTHVHRLATLRNYLSERHIAIWNTVMSLYKPNAFLS